MKLDNEKYKNPFFYAIRGCRQALKTETNLRFDFIVAIIVIICGFIFKINYLEWIACIISIGFVLSAEIMNTAIETVVDMYTREKNKYAEMAKDISAGAVLIIAISAFIVGVIIFIPKIINFIN